MAWLVKSDASSTARASTAMVVCRYTRDMPRGAVPNGLPGARDPAGAIAARKRVLDTGRWSQCGRDQEVVHEPIAVVADQYAAAADRDGAAERFSIRRGEDGDMLVSAVAAAAEYIDDAGVAVVAPGVLQQELGGSREAAAPGPSP